MSAVHVTRVLRPIGVLLGGSGLARVLLIPAPQAAAPKPQRTPAPIPGAEGERGPRKRRRRRGGRPIEGADALPMQNLPSQATPASSDASPSLLSRIGKGLKALVTRAPRSQH